MATSTVEDYVKRIYLLQSELSTDELLPLGALATAMSVVPGTATSMVKALSEARLVHYKPHHGVRLTAPGEKLALHVLRRHRLIELFLVKVLKFDWTEVHAEAEELEHAISDALLEKIDEHLGRPKFDPHGDPIPTAEGKLPLSPARTLIDCVAGERVRIACVNDQEPQFLKYAAEHGLLPGTLISVESRDDIGGAVVIRAGDRPPLTLGDRAARKLQVYNPA